MEIMQPYAWGLTSLLVFVLITLVQSGLVGGRKAKAGLTPGSEPDADYDSSLYRLNRSHQNAVENLPAIATAFFACVLAGAAAWWVNLLMILYLVYRLAQKIGTQHRVRGR